MNILKLIKLFRKTDKECQERINKLEGIISTESQESRISELEEKTNVSVVIEPKYDSLLKEYLPSYKEIYDGSGKHVGGIFIDDKLRDRNFEAIKKLGHTQILELMGYLSKVVEESGNKSLYLLAARIAKEKARIDYLGLGDYLPHENRKANELLEKAIDYCMKEGTDGGFVNAIGIINFVMGEYEKKISNLSWERRVLENNDIKIITEWEKYNKREINEQKIKEFVGIPKIEKERDGYSKYLKQWYARFNKLYEKRKDNLNKNVRTLLARLEHGLLDLPSPNFEEKYGVKEYYTMVARMPEFTGPIPKDFDWHLCYKCTLPII